MNEHERLIPPPPAVRTRLAQNIRERRLLRALLRLSVRDAEERQQQTHHGPRHEPDAPGGVSCA
jgi:hypothetical protein